MSFHSMEIRVGVAVWNQKIRLGIQLRAVNVQARGGGIDLSRGPAIGQDTPLTQDSLVRNHRTNHPKRISGAPGRPGVFIPRRSALAPPHSL